MPKVNILMDGDKVCIAWFKKKIKKFILSTLVEPVEGGTITGAGTYNEGTVVTVEATPNPDYDFDHWEGDIQSKWSGLGITLFSTNNNMRALSQSFGEQVDNLLANGFTQLRIDIPTWGNIADLEISKSAVAIAVAKGANVIWGVGASIEKLTTASNWPDYRQAILDAAQWAQDNGVYEFQIGNEEEAHVDGTTMTTVQIIANLKAVAAEVKAIFTIGKISYGVQYGYENDWISVGKGEIDILAINVYSYAAMEWKTRITNMINAFGADGTYITEFGPSYISLDDYSTDEAVQAAAVTEMIDYIRASGMKRAIFFCYYDDSRPFGPEGFGVLKTDGTYRLLWQSLINSVQAGDING